MTALAKAEKTRRERVVRSDKPQAEVRQPPVQNVTPGLPLFLQSTSNEVSQQQAPTLTGESPSPRIVPSERDRSQDKKNGKFGKVGDPLAGEPTLEKLTKTSEARSIASPAIPSLDIARKQTEISVGTSFPSPSISTEREKPQNLPVPPIPKGAAQSPKQKPEQTDAQAAKEEMAGEQVSEAVVSANNGAKTESQAAAQENTSDKKSPQSATSSFTQDGQNTSALLPSMTTTQGILPRLGGAAPTLPVSVDTGGAAAGGAGASTAPTGGFGTSAGLSGSVDASQDESGGSEETIERMDAASPENADADAVAEAQENPEGAAEAVEIGESPESGMTLSDAVDTADRNFAPENPLTSASGNGSQSSSAAAPQTIPPLGPGINTGANALATSEETPQSEQNSEPSTGEGLDSSERDAALQSLTGNGGSGDAAMGGGGGGGAALQVKTEPEAPDVSGMPPEAAVSNVESLPPAKLAGALGGVTDAVNGSVAEEAQTLASNPPQIMCSSGSPITKQKSGSSVPVESSKSLRAVEKVNRGSSQPVPPPQPLPAPPPSPVNSIREPNVPSGSAQLGPEDAQAIRSSVRSLPVSDPGLNIDAGVAPSIHLAGEADPGQVHEQGRKLQSTTTEAASEGRRDAGQPMGESNIYPSVQPELLSAQLSSDPGVSAAGAAGTQSIGISEKDEAASIVAQEQNGPQLKAAAAQAKTQMAAQRASHAEKAASETTESRKEAARLEMENAAAQDAERGNAKAEVAKARSEWTSEQQAKVEAANEEAQKEQETADDTVVREEQQANNEARRQVDLGNNEAAQHREVAQQQAARKRAEAEQESSGVFGWIASKAKAFFDRIKSAINAVFEVARRLVKAAIEKAKRLAVAAIEKAQKAIVAAIRAAGNALIAIGDRLLAAFPALRDKWRKFIESKVKAAEAAVNRLAEALKAGVKKLLDLLGKALDFALRMLQKGMLAVVDAYKAAVMGVIKAAKAVADAVGAFITLIKDVAANPLGWIRNLGAAVVDGIRNHLWKAFKLAVKNWFNSKLEEVLGIGGMIWGVLKQGGLELKDVGQMAWEGLKAAIPIALITILVEKLVAMIVPAAGAVIAIIEGLQAAWGTVSRIIAAFGKFFAFLKAVKNGGAGPQFADAVAAAAVVVIDFVANWLLRKIRKPAGRIGGKIKAIAKKIMARLKRASSRVGKAIKKVGGKVKSKVKGARDKFKGWRDKKSGKGRKDPNKDKRDKERAKQERLDKAVREIKPKLAALLKKGISPRMLKLRLALWQIRYRLSSLKLEGNRIVATVNPSADLESIKQIPPLTLGKELEKVLASIESEFFLLQEQQRSPSDSKRIAEAERATTLGSESSLGLSVPEQVEFFRKIRKGKIEMPLPTEIKNPKPGGRTHRSPILRPGEEGFSVYANRDSLNRILLSNFYVIGAGKYPYEDNVLEAPSRRGLVRALEPARGEGSGLFAASQVSEGLIGRGKMTEAEAFSGKNAPLAAVGSARALEVDRNLREPSTDPATRSQDDDARKHRLRALRHIFVALAESLESTPGELITNSSEQAALQEVGKAFMDWARANVLPISKKGTMINPGEAHATEIALKMKLQVFLQTRIGK